MRKRASSIVLGSLGSYHFSKDEISFLKRETIPGLVLFKWNIPEETYSEVRENILKKLYEIQKPSFPLIIAVDQEGGRVHRFSSDFPNEGSALNLSSKIGDQFFNYGSTVAKALADLDINVNLAPVVDILTNPLNRGIGDRAFGLNAQDVCSKASKYLEGLQSIGVMGCLKHFPGQGSELNDAHDQEVVVSLSKERFMSRELLPYSEILNKASMVLVSHALCPHLDPSKKAVQSFEIITNLLKRNLGFQGLVISDDMRMKAIPQSSVEWKESVVEAVSAGIDLLLVCKDVEYWIYAIEALEEESKRSKAFEKRLVEASEKVSYFRKRLLKSRFL